MKAKTAFIGANRRIILDAVAMVNLNFALIIDVAHPEGDDPFGDDETFEDLFFDVFGVFLGDRAKAIQNLLSGLEEFLLIRVIRGQFVIYGLKMLVHKLAFFPLNFSPGISFDKEIINGCFLFPNII